MMKRLRHSLLIIVAFLAGSLVSIATTVALAHGGDTSKIHACVRNTQVGNLSNIRIVDANTNCNNNETALDWNIQGVQGPTGPQGPAGPTASGSGYFGLPFVCFGPCELSSIANKVKGKDFSNMVGQLMFEDVDISGVILKNSDLDGSRFNGTNISNADFSSTSLKRGINIGGGWGLPQGFFNVTATNSNFSNATLGDGIVGGLEIKDSNFQNANFTGTKLFNITNSQFQNANFTNADISGGGFGQGIFTNANFQNTNFSNGGFDGVNLQGALNMDTANLTGVTWTNTICPDGTNSDDNGNTCIGHLTP